MSYTEEQKKEIEKMNQLMNENDVVDSIKEEASLKSDNQDNDNGKEIRKNFYEGLSKDELLRSFAFEILLDGNEKLINSYDELNLSIQSTLKSVNEIDVIIHGKVEEHKEEILNTLHGDLKSIEEKTNELKIVTETINSLSLNTISKAMIEQINTFNTALDEENKKRVEFFDEEYNKLSSHINSAINDSNIKTMLKNINIFIFAGLIISQIIICSALVWILK